MILVTGATGQVGREIVKQLNAKGLAFRVLVRSPEKFQQLGLTAPEVFKGDMGDIASLEKACVGVKRVFINSSSDPRQSELQCNVLQAAKHAGATHIAKLSMLGVAENFPPHIGGMHFKTEQEIKKSGLKWTIIRPHMFMQLLLGGVAKTVKANGAIYFPMKEGRVSLVDVRDVASVAVATLTADGHEGKTYEVTGPESLSFTEIAQTLSKVLGKSVKYTDIPPAAAIQGLVSAGVPDWIASGLIGLVEYFSTGSAADVSRVVRDVAKIPGRTFENFVREQEKAFA